MLSCSAMQALVRVPEDAAGVGDAVVQLLNRRAVSLQHHAELPRSLAACLADGAAGGRAMATAAEELRA